MKDAGRAWPFVVGKRPSEPIASVPLNCHSEEKWYALNPLRAKVNLFYLRPSSYRAVNTPRLGYKKK
jgi:hypothetical protein